MSTPYLTERVQTGLTLAIWYARFGKAQKAERVFNKTLEMIEQEDGLYEKGLHRVLGEYAARFRRAGRFKEANLLADLAGRNCARFPDTYYADGEEIPWWKQASFLRTLPLLPVAFRASRAHSPSGNLFLPVALGVFLVGGILVGAAYPVLKWLGEGLVIPGFIAVVILSGVLAERWRIQSTRRKGNESWCRLNEAGIEYHEPDRTYSFRWAEIDQVWTDWVSGEGEDTTYDAVTVKAGKQKFQLSACFFTEQEVRWVDGICKLKAGIERN